MIRSMSCWLRRLQGEAMAGFVRLRAVSLVLTVWIAPLPLRFRLRGGLRPGATPAATPPAAERSDAPYHQTDMSKPQEQRFANQQRIAGGGHRRTSRRCSASPRLKSFRLRSRSSGPHYGQRLVVEGTFADGHQEDLTSRRSLAISNPKVAKLDKDDIVPSRRATARRRLPQRSRAIARVPR